MLEVTQDGLLAHGLSFAKTLGLKSGGKKRILIRSGLEVVCYSRVE